ncbi:DEAD/DEAH box helicase [Adhaeribacter pallidiroseus]|uniref:RNA helicase n=1 Tax=Adhaeribacter pallidiroseus TaxID=2072847 RepID=A0A369QH11_9BACT|nr:DEAD/DEAH box helicase [Adhaeribacter pallidiroseus]RDC62506.1 RNA helicase [Adhaeribacter pallidiroseus]
MLEAILDKLRITDLNPMQAAALAAAEQQDVVLLAPTGSGKTLGFLLPLLKRLQPAMPGVQALVLVPTRELALQIEQVFRQMGTGFGVTCFYGGHATRTERSALGNPPAVVVGTPGRIAFHLREKNLIGTPVHTLILDEFDKSLEFGFEAEMQFIIQELPQVTRRLLTSATAMAAIPLFTQVQNPVLINFLQDTPSTPDLAVKIVPVAAGDKATSLFRLLCKIGNKPTLVFCNQRDAVEELSQFLNQKKLDHGVFHGGLEQPDRERALLKFRNGTYHLLLSTDLASRGLDIPEIENVIHYELTNAETYLHRNGRTARMHAKGTAYVLVQPGQKPAYLPESLATELLPTQVVLPPPSPWETVYLNAGKKDKISKGDVAGFLLQKNFLQKEELGLIYLQDYVTFAAVSRKKADALIQKLQNEKIKNKKVKLGRAK